MRRRFLVCGACVLGLLAAWAVGGEWWSPPENMGPVKIPLGEDPVIVEMDAGATLPRAYFAVHCEPTTANEVIWGALENLIAAAQARRIKITIEFTPQWADMILGDRNKLETMRAWKALGHEIAAHHHHLDYGPGWDGFSNDPEAQRKPRYRGDMADYLQLMNALAAPGVIHSLGNPEDSDWPVGVPFRTRGFASPEAISVPTFKRINGQGVWRLGYGALVNPQKLPELKALYPTAGAEEIFGVVTHAFNYQRTPDLIEDWFDFIADQDPSGARNRTTAEILTGLPTPGDYDNDGDVDLDDYAEFARCMTGPEAGPIEPDCGVFDFEPDDDVDMMDVGAFQSVFGGVP